MYSNDMDAANYQQKMQMQQLASNAGQQAITNESQGLVGLEGEVRARGLSATQIANQQKSGHVAMAILASKGQDSEMARMADPNYAAFKMASVPEQALLRERLKGFA
jgi:trans-aconitate methyltransferase